MQYNNQSSIAGYTGYQFQSGTPHLGYHAAEGYPWYSQTTPQQYTPVEYGMNYPQPSYQSHCSTLPTNYYTMGAGVMHNTLLEHTGFTGQTSQGNQPIETLTSQNCYETQQSSQNGSQRTCTSSGKVCSVASSNPLSLNFYELRQAIGDEDHPANEDRKKYGDRKPPYSYVAMIHMAMTSNPNRKCTLREILDYIEDRFPYYKQHSRKLHGAIRHNLTLNDCFVKAGRRLGDKGCLWTLDKDYEGMFEHGSLLRRKTRLLEGRVDKYKRNSRKSKKSNQSSPSGDQKEKACERFGQSTSPSGSSACSVSPSTSNSCDSTPVQSDASPEASGCLSPFNLEQFSDICVFPDFNNNNKNDVTDVCRRLSTELSEGALFSETTPAQEPEIQQAPVTDRSACALSFEKNSESVSPFESQQKCGITRTELPGFDVEFPAFLDIPDILSEVDMSQVQSGFNTNSLPWN